MSDIIPPHSPANEEAILGAILLNPECLQAFDLEPEEFFIQRNRFVYQAVLELRGNGQSIDVITVSNTLNKAGHLNETGGLSRITELVNACPSSTHAASYAQSIRDDAMRRKAIEIAGAIAKIAFDRDSNLTSCIPAQIDKLSRLAITNGGAVHWQKFVSELYDDMVKMSENPTDTYGITTGILDFDLITGGLIPGEVMKLSGEPGVGKSMLAMQMVCHAAAHGHPGACYHLEMSGKAVARRVISAMSKVSTRAMKTGRIQDDQWPDLTSAIEATGIIPIYMSDSSTWTTSGLRVDIERLLGLYKIEWVLVDYEALLCDDPEKDDNMRSKIISSRLHGIIKDLGLAGLVIDDMNKVGIASAGGKGQASLAGSARKLYDADSIWILKKNKTVPNLVNLVSEKLREGEGDSSRIIQLRRTPGIPEFQNVSNKKEIPIVQGRDN